MRYIKMIDVGSVPSNVLRLTTPGMASVMKKWVREKYDGDAFIMYEDDEPLGWMAVVDGEISVYVKRSERRKGVGTKLLIALQDTSMLSAKPHNRAGEKFFEKNKITIS